MEESNTEDKTVAANRINEEEERNEIRRESRKESRRVSRRDSRVILAEEHPMKKANIFSKLLFM